MYIENRYERNRLNPLELFAMKPFYLWNGQQKTKSNEIRIIIGSLVFLSALESYAADPPNVVLIMADQLTHGVLSCYGGPVHTPNLDRLTCGMRINYYGLN
jgi:hypothetical protein